MTMRAQEEAARIRVMHAAFDSGVNAIDTAPLYELGAAEVAVGRALRGRRDRVVVMTKVGLRWDDPRGVPLFETVDATGARRVVRRNSRPDSIKLEVDRSLARLGLDHLDLVQVHQPDLETPISETMDALVELRRAGKIREIGVSNYDAAQLEAAHRALGEVPLASVQPGYSLLRREAERDIFPFARARHVAVLVYSPLGHGLLTGGLVANQVFPKNDFRHRHPDFTPENRRRVNAALTEALRPIAQARGKTVAQIALAFVLAQAGVTSAIVGARTPEQALENAAAGEVRLTGLEVLSIRTAFERLVLEPSPVRLAARLARLVRGGLSGARRAGRRLVP